MLTSVRVHNYRTFDELSIESLSCVNLVTGRNNSGKTSLLEALFLLSGAGNPQLVMNSNITRGIDSVSGPRETLWETLWKPMFYGLNPDRGFEITGSHSSHGLLALFLSLERSNLTEIPFPLDDSGAISTRDISGGPKLLLSYQIGSETKVEGWLQIKGQAIEVHLPSIDVPFPTVILVTRLGNLQEDATRLGRLRKRKQGDLVLRALQIIEPRLLGIEDNTASGFPLVWGDIGLSELVPLAVMGEGMTRIARLVLAIANSPGGLVLVDEIENGLHHSVLPAVWEVVDKAAQQFNTQIVATTHSFECVQAAGQYFRGSDRFLLHRLETSGSGSRCVTYQPEDIEAAMLHDLEVR